ncbi:MAG TPA: hypothetical protein VF648_07010 [Pyrinomonadaceae bacterium]|jgi:hypothetical protein
MDKIDLKLSSEKVTELADKVYDYADDDDERAQAILVLLAALTFEKNQNERERILDAARRVIFPKTEAFWHSSNGFIQIHKDTAVFLSGGGIVSTAIALSSDCLFPLVNIGILW